jgi:hypothetical protein
MRLSHSSTSIPIPCVVSKVTIIAKLGGNAEEANRKIEQLQRRLISRPAFLRKPHFLRSAGTHRKLSPLGK